MRDVIPPPLLLCRVPYLNLHIVAVFVFGVADLHPPMLMNHIDPLMSDSENDLVRPVSRVALL